MNTMKTLALTALVCTLAPAQETVREFVTGDTNLTQSCMVYHVTNPMGGFGTGLLIQNDEDRSFDFGFYPMDADGNRLALQHFTIAAGQTLDLDLNTVLPAPSQATHLQMIPFEGMRVTTYYTFKDRPGSPAHVPCTGEIGSHWRFFPGDWNLDFDGFALVNRDAVPGSIDLRQVDFQNNVIQTVTVAEHVPPFGKVTHLVGGTSGSAFEPLPGTYFEVVGDVNFGVIGLRGTLIEQPNAPMWNNPMTRLALLDVSIDRFEAETSQVQVGNPVVLRIKIAHYKDWQLHYETTLSDPSHRLELESQSYEADGTLVLTLTGMEADTTFELFATGTPSVLSETLTVTVEPGLELQ